MQRKVIKQGNGSYTITLPKKWVDMNNITQHTLLNLDSSNAILEISANTSPKKQSIALECTDVEFHTLRRMVTNAYRSGYHRIEVSIEKGSYEVLNSIVTDLLIGFEIISYNQSIAILENVTEPSVDHFENILLKFIYSISQLSDSISSSKNEKSFIENMEKQIIRYSNYLRRLVHTTDTIHKSYSQFVSLLNHSQREVYNLFKDNSKLSKEDLQLFSHYIFFIDVAKKSIQKKDGSIIHESDSQITQMYAEIKKIENHSENSMRVYCANRFAYQANNVLTSLLH